MNYKANDVYEATLRATWTADPADTTMSVTDIPDNLPTIITSNAGSTSEKKFSVTGTSGDSPANYALTGVTLLSGVSENVSKDVSLTCLNHEEFFNQYNEIVNEDYLRLVDQDDDPATPDTGKTLFYLKDGQAFTKDDAGNVTLITQDIKDEDDMASNSATALATQQSIKAYVDTQDTLYTNYNIGMARQAIINGGCKVAQRAVGTLSTSAVYGSVDRIYGIAEGTVGAGTIQQEVAAGLSFEYAIILAGVTLTGAGKGKVGYRMEAKDAKNFKNKTASFSVRVYHNIGSAKTYTIYINKANAADNFSAVTAIGNNGGTSVGNTTETLLKYEAISLGDCSNGIEIIIECNSGEITSKNLYFAELQFNMGSVALPFQPKSYEEELDDCKPYYQKSYDYATALGTDTYLGAVQTRSASTYRLYQGSVQFPVEMRTTPVVVLYSKTGASGKIRNIDDANDITVSTASLIGTKSYIIDLNNAATANKEYCWHWTASAEL